MPKTTKNKTRAAHELKGNSGRGKRNPGPRRNSSSAAAQLKTPEATSVGPTIVGIGASAGGFEAVGALIKDLPDDSGMAFVLVQHLDPTHESKLTELLSRASPLPISEVKSGVKIEPNQIYVMPPNTNLVVSKGELRLSPRKNSLTHMPVDWFFRSLAEEMQNRAIGVVLSGMGTDGTLGLEAIKGHGGITFAQDERSAKFFGMPGSAMKAGCVDFILPPDRIAKELVRIARHPYLTKPDDDQEKAPLAALRERKGKEPVDELHSIFAILRARTNVDFSLYKHSTLKRRIQRRMILHKVDTHAQYLKSLQSNMAEVDELYNDLLINVTGFFRDPHVFQALKKRVFPKLMKSRPSDSPLRFWVCGCSSGEEAYSLAISIQEYFEASQSYTAVQIFATDIANGGLEKARAGIFPENISIDVSPERLRRYFVKTNSNYKVNKTIRDMCVFARQNMVTDPPFSNLDLITCRNVMIYLGPALQKKVLPIFHYALKQAGFLLLGTSETIGSATDLFSLVDRRSKIYKSSIHPRPAMAAPMTAFRSVSPAGLAKSEVFVESKESDLQDQADKLILNTFSPAAIVIDSHMRVLHFRGRTAPYLEHAPGKASLDLLRMTREDLAIDLRAAVNKAIKKDVRLKQHGVTLFGNGHARYVDIEVVPFKTKGGDRCFLILFQEAPAPTEPELARSDKRSAILKSRENRELAKLREDLASTRVSLRAIIEGEEVTNEELKSVNEEIQSSNEELETAKEELQSTNEELTTLNEELQTRNAELSQANNDLTNLLSSVNVSVVMLSSDLTIRRFTPMAEKVFSLIPSDVGRKLTDLIRSIDIPDLEEALKRVMDDLTSLEREVQDRNGRWYSLRIRPYRTRENKIDGAVIVLVDVDEHKRMIEVMSLIKTPLIALYPDLRVRYANTAFYKMFGVEPRSTEGRLFYELGDGQWNVARLKTLLEEILPARQNVTNFRVEANFAKLGRRTMLVNARQFNEDGKGMQFIALAIDDVTEKPKKGG